MAKDLPYFKFFCSEWNDGEITLEDFETQGLFINICSYYWSNECSMTLTKLKKRFRGHEDLIDDIVNLQLIKCQDDQVSINFLDEQLSERSNLSNKNRINAQKRWQKKNEQSENDAIALNSHSQSDAIKRRKENKRGEENEIFEIDDYLKNERLVSAIMKNFDLTQKKFDTLWKDFRLNYVGQKLSEDQFTDASRHFKNWLSKNHTKQTNKLDYAIRKKSS